MNARRVYVVDDEEPIRRSLRLMLTVEGYAVTLFESGNALLAASGGLMPGVLMLDLRMPGLDGMEVLQELGAEGAGLPTIVMTGHGDLTVTVAAFRRGAVAFLEKPFTRAAAVAALDKAFLKLEQPDAYRRQLGDAVRALERLAPQEREVLGHFAAGGTSEAIAAELSLGPDDLEAARLRIVSKLGVTELKDAVALALETGLPGESWPAPDIY